MVKKTGIILILIVLSCILSGNKASAALCPAGYTYEYEANNGVKCYSPLRGASTWNAAYADCSSVGGDILNGPFKWDLCSITGGCAPITGVRKIIWRGTGDSQTFGLRYVKYNPNEAGPASSSEGCCCPIASYVSATLSSGTCYIGPAWVIGDNYDGTHYYWCMAPPSCSASTLINGRIWEVKNSSGNRILAIDEDGDMEILSASVNENTTPTGSYTNTLIIKKVNDIKFVFNETEAKIAGAINNYQSQAVLDNINGDDLAIKNASGTIVARFDGATGNIYLKGARSGPACPPIITSFYASPSVLQEPGGPTTLSWTSVNANSCTASAGWSGAKSVSGSESVSITTTTTFTLTCSSSGGSVSKSIQVPVQRQVWVWQKLVGSEVFDSSVPLGNKYSCTGALTEGYAMGTADTLSGDTLLQPQLFMPPPVQPSIWKAKYQCTFYWMNI